jgi:hypothetical protein
MHKVKLLSGTGGIFKPKSAYVALENYLRKNNTLSSKSKLADLLMEMFMCSPYQLFGVPTQTLTHEGIGLEEEGLCAGSPGISQ